MDIIQQNGPRNLVRVKAGIEKEINMSNKFEAFFKSFSTADEQLDFKMAHETIGQKVPVISTGSLVLDDALSCGGVPCGRLIQYYGPAGSGKTLMAMLTMVNAQKKDPTAYQMFIDAEQTFSPTWARALGLKTEKILLVDGDTAVNGRKCFEMLLGVPKEDARTHEYKGKSTEGFLDKVINKEFNVNLIVLDSLGSIIPPGEDISRVGKMNISLMARFLTTTFKKLSIEVSKANIPFIIINHKRDNMDPYGSDHTYSGGNTFSHMLSANIYFEAIQRKDAMIMDEKENKIGHAVRASVEKSKFGVWPRKCEFKVNFSIGVVDQHEEIAQLAMDYNIIDKPTSMSYTYGDRKWVGLAKLHEAIVEDVMLANDLIAKIGQAREDKQNKVRQEQEVLKSVEVVEDAETEAKTKKSKKVM